MTIFSRVLNSINARMPVADQYDDNRHLKFLSNIDHPDALALSSDGLAPRRAALAIVGSLSSSSGMVLYRVGVARIAGKSFPQLTPCRVEEMEVGKASYGKPRTLRSSGEV